MSTVPAPCAGDVAVIEVGELKMELPAANEPKLTLVKSVKSVPVRVTELPPDSGPAVGLMALTVGAAP